MQGVDEPAPKHGRARLIDGRLQIYDSKRLVGIEELPEEGRYATLAGFVVYRLGRFPSTGDRFEWRGFNFEVVDMDRHRVDRVLVERAS